MPLGEIQQRQVSTGSPVVTSLPIDSILGQPGRVNDIFDRARYLSVGVKLFLRQLCIRQRFSYASVGVNSVPVRAKWAWGMAIHAWGVGKGVIGRVRDIFWSGHVGPRGRKGQMSLVHSREKDIDIYRSE